MAGIDRKGHLHPVDWSSLSLLRTPWWFCSVAAARRRGAASAGPSLCLAVLDRELPTALWKRLDITVRFSLGVLLTPEQGGCPADSPGERGVAAARAQRCISYQSLQLMNLRKICRGCRGR